MELKSIGLKNTSARNAVLKALKDKDKPLDIAEIQFYIGESGDKADQATVYRIINAFYKKGIVKRIEIGEGKYRYEISEEDHHHLICTECGSIQDVEDKFMADIEAGIKKNKKFLVKNHSLEFFGICQNCQS